jgi:hypothetical protein
MTELGGIGAVAAGGSIARDRFAVTFELVSEVS